MMNIWKYPDIADRNYFYTNVQLKNVQLIPKGSLKIVYKHIRSRRLEYKELACSR